MPSAALPPQFAELEPFAHWALPSTAERVARRLASSRDEINAFHAAAAPRLDDMLGYLNRHALQDIPKDDRPLLHLVLALAEIGPYAEWFNGDSETPITRGLSGRIRIVSEPRE